MHLLLFSHTHALLCVLDSADEYAHHRVWVLVCVRMPQVEVEEEDADADDGSDEEAKAIYNPKNLPLGWDGKPIPYWLYKVCSHHSPTACRSHLHPSLF